MTHFIENIRNRFDFFLRNHITFSRKNYNEIPQDLSNIFENNKQIELCEYIKMKYDYGLLENSTKRNFLLNLYFLHIFDKYILPKPQDNLSVLDIGSKNWAYVKSEYLFFKKYSNNLTLNGIELDAYRMYSNFYNRLEIAKFYTKDLANTNYIAGDLLEHKQKYDYIIWILPFITQYPLVKWGLPLEYFKPELMLTHAYELLNRNGEMYIINQGREEYLIQQQLNKSLNLLYEPIGELEDIYNIFKNKRYACKIIKNK